MAAAKFHVVATLKNGTIVDTLFDEDQSLPMSHLTFVNARGDRTVIPYDQVSHFKVEKWGEERQAVQGMVWAVQSPLKTHPTRRKLDMETQYRDKYRDLTDDQLQELNAKHRFDLIEQDRADLWPHTKLALLMVGLSVLGGLIATFVL